MLRKIEKKKEMMAAEDETVAQHHNSENMHLNKLWERPRKADMLQSVELQSDSTE